MEKLFDKYINRQFDKNEVDVFLDEVFSYYPIKCENIRYIDNKNFDKLVSQLQKNPIIKKIIIEDIINIVKKASDGCSIQSPIIDELTGEIKSVIKGDLADNFSVESYAKQKNISVYYLVHLFKKTTGMTVLEYRDKERVHKAIEYLEGTNESISEISIKTGFCSPSYFSEVFKKYTTVTPTEFRKIIKEEKNAYKLKHFNYQDKILYNKIKSIDICGDVKEILKEDCVLDYIVSLPNEEYGFLHETAIIEYKGVLFAAWYNNKKLELTGRTTIRFSTSNDDGKTWSEAKIVRDDISAEILYCPPVFAVENETLYMFMNEMVGPDLIHSFDLLKYNNDTKEFQLVWLRPIPFKLNTNVYKLKNGKLMLPGRIGKLDGFPNTPAVLISDSGKIEDEWRLIKIQADGKLPDGANFVHPEISAIVLDERIYVFSRNDERNVPLVYISNDFGETWSDVLSHNIPFSSSKIYSGTLKNGVNYVVGNVYPGRNKLEIFFSKPNEINFDKKIVLQDGFSQHFRFGKMWHYPAACEYNNKLYVIYTVNMNWNTRGAVVSVIDIDKI